MPENSVYHKMFKAYDIRGTYPEINEGIYYWTGYAFVRLLLEPENLPLKVNLVRDIRFTSPNFYKALYNGIKDAGGEPIALGLGSTDFLYAACQKFAFPGIMVTASHNPKNDNGMKLVKVAPNSVGLESGLDRIRDYVIKEMESTDLEKLAETFSIPEEASGIKSEVTQFFEEKLDHIGIIDEVDLFLTQQERKLKVVVDTANGMGGWFMPNISGMYENIEFVPLYWELDGEFPNHPADPLKPENLKDLQKLVLEQNADFGVAFDGDADRAFFVDENGNGIDGNFLVSMFAQTLIKDTQSTIKCQFNPAVVYSVTGSRCMPESINEVGGAAIPAKQGHIYFKKTMQDYNAVYGGEFTGHHYFADFGYMDSGFMALVLFIKTVVLSGSKVSQLFSGLRQNYFLSEEFVLKIPEGKTFEDLKNKVRASFSDASSIHEIDGIAVFYPEWKFNLRPSNTEPVLRFLLESKVDDFEFNVDRKVADVRAVLGC